MQAWHARDRRRPYHLPTALDRQDLDAGWPEAWGGRGLHPPENEAHTRFLQQFHTLRHPDGERSAPSWTGCGRIAPVETLSPDVHAITRVIKKSTRSNPLSYWKTNRALITIGPWSNSSTARPDRQ